MYVKERHILHKFIIVKILKLATKATTVQCLWISLFFPETFLTTFPIISTELEFSYYNKGICFCPFVYVCDCSEIAGCRPKKCGTSHFGISISTFKSNP